MDWQQILVTGTYPWYLHTFFLFVLFWFSKFYIFGILRFFFLIVNMGQYGRKNSNDISSASTLQIHSQKSCILQGRVSTEVVQRIMKFEILDFCHFYFLFLLTWGHMGVKVSNDISSETTHQIFSLKFRYTYGEGLQQICQKNRDIWHFEFLTFFVVVLFWPFNMVVNGEL